MTIKALPNYSALQRTSWFKKKKIKTLISLNPRDLWIIEHQNKYLHTYTHMYTIARVDREGDDENT